MKTMKKDGTIVRVPEKDVERRLRMGYTYCSKTEWKNQVRVKPTAPVEKEVNEQTEASNEKSRKERPRKK